MLEEMVKSTFAHQSFVGKDEVFLGETVKSKIKIIWHELFKDRLYNGQELVLCEGPIVIAKGVILEVLNDFLRK